MAFQMRNGTSADWALYDPVLAQGEPAYDRDSGAFKIGNGAAKWSELPPVQPTAALISQLLPSRLGDPALERKYATLTAVDAKITTALDELDFPEPTPGAGTGTETPGFLFLTATEQVPNGTPSGTLIFRSATTTTTPPATGGGGTTPTEPTPTPVTISYLTADYNASTAAIANPERGFFQYTETHWRTAAGEGHVPLDPTVLAGRRGTTAESLNGFDATHRSVVFRYYVMEYNRTVDTIPAAFLAALKADLDAARAAGVKLLIRFCYSNDGANTTQTGPYNTDTTPARTLSHVSQLKATLVGGRDVIMAIEAGLIGTWGEWYYTDNWGNIGALTVAQWTDRAALITALLNIDPSVHVLLRYPGVKHRYMQGTGLPENALTRLGFHNDAFVADAAGEDWGTYNEFNNGQTVAQLKSYLQAETSRPVYMAGETAGVSSRSTADNLQTELDLYNWQSLNPNYHPDVLAAIPTATRKTIGDRLGYRLELVQATVPKAGPLGAKATVTLKIRNAGYALPVFPRDVVLVFAGPIEHRQTLTLDVRTLTPGQTLTHTQEVTLPGTDGNYSLRLAMPDKLLPTRPEYSVQLASSIPYANGQNDLGVTFIAGAGGAGAPSTPAPVTMSLLADFASGDGLSNTSSGGKSTTISRPSNAQVGDLLVAFLTHQTAGAPAFPWAPLPAGWTQISNDSVESFPAGGRPSAVAVYPIPDAAALAALPASWTFSVKAEYATGRQVVSINRLTNANLTTPSAGSTSWRQGTDTNASIDTPALVASVGRGLELVMFVVNNGGGVVMPPLTVDGMTEILNVGFPGGGTSSLTRIVVFAAPFSSAVLPARSVVKGSPWTVPQAVHFAIAAK